MSGSDHQFIDKTAGDYTLLDELSTIISNNGLQIIIPEKDPANPAKPIFIDFEIPKLQPDGSYNIQPLIIKFNNFKLVNR